MKNLLNTKIYIENINSKISKIILDPLEKGFGHTIGNAIRRVLISSIPGYAITEIEINDILHEFQNEYGIKEDVLNIILNLKEISISLLGKNESIFEISKDNIGKVYAKDIVSNDDFKIFNPEHLICNITEENTKLKIKFKVNKGIGYSSSIENRNINKNNKIELNNKKLFVDSIYNPINNVSYNVEATRFEKNIDLDKLILNIETNGSITPEESIKYAVNILIKKLNIFNDFKNNINNIDEVTNTNKINDSFLLQTIENLNLTIRSYNCLKSENIINIQDLIKKTESDLLNIPNFGKKSLLEIKEILFKFNLNLKIKKIKKI